MDFSHPAAEFAKSDFEGLHQQHAAAWSSFNTMLQIVILLEAVPWVAAGALIAKDHPAEKLFSYVPMGYVFCFGGAIGTIGYVILVYNRFLIIFYARSLNCYRALFAEQLAGIPSILPRDPQSPPMRESSGIMLLLTLSLNLMNCFYLYLGFSIFFSKWFASGAAVLIVGYAVGWYFWSTEDVKVAGARRR